jgi:hypothetical protein
MMTMKVERVQPEEEEEVGQVVVLHLNQLSAHDLVERGLQDLVEHLPRIDLRLHLQLEAEKEMRLINELMN